MPVYAIYQSSDDTLPTNAADGFLKRNTGNTGWEQVAYGSSAQNVATSNSAGTSNTPARADHTHALTSATLISVMGAIPDAQTSGSLQTTNGTANQVVATLTTTSNTVVHVRAFIGGRRSDVTGNAYGATLCGTFVNTAGTLTQLGSTAVVESQVTALWLVSANLVVSGTSINAVATGIAGQTIQWRANISACITA